MKKQGRFIRKVVNNLDYGVFYLGRPIHSNKKEEIVLFFKGKKRFLHYLNNQYLSQHFSGKDTFYFTGNTKGDETLFMIDIDCHNAGTPKGATDFALLLQTFLPNLYYEVSTNGIGIHGYLILKKQGYQAIQINCALKRFELWLKQFVKDFDIEDVEVKGTLPVWHPNMKLGQLAKVPREIGDEKRFEDFKNTCYITVDELNQLTKGIENATIQKPKKEQKTEKQKTEKSKTRIEEIQRPNRKLDILPRTPTDIENDGTRKKSSKRNAGQVGSTSGKIANGNWKLFIPIARHLVNLPNIKRPKHEKLNIPVEVIAIWLWIGYAFHLNMNADGSNPTARWKALWSECYKSGEVPSAWNDKRHKAIRDWLSSFSMLDWKAQEYWFVEGTHVGKACKWNYSDEMIKIIVSFLKTKRSEEREASFIELVFVQVKPIVPQWVIPITIFDLYQKLPPPLRLVA